MSSSQYRQVIQLSGYPLTADDIPFSLSVDWGDDTLVEEFADLSSFPSLSHDYAEEGTYKAVVNLTNPCGSVKQVIPILVSSEYRGITPVDVPSDGFPLTILSAVPAENAAHNIPPFTATGTLKIVDLTDFIADPPVVQYGFTLARTSELE